MTFNILTLALAVFHLARYHFISSPKSVGFLKHFRIFFCCEGTEETEEETYDETGKNYEIFDNFAKLIQKEVDDCDKIELEVLLEKWTGEIVDLSKRNIKTQRFYIIICEIFVEL